MALYEYANDFVCHIEENDNATYLAGIELLESPMTTQQELNTDMDDRKESIKELKLSLSRYAEHRPNIIRFVLLPTTMSYWKAIDLKLKDYVKYPFIDVEYGSESYFEWLKKYRRYYSKYIAVRDCDLWHNGDNWIVNFSLISYEAFISKRHSPQSIPIGWYLLVLQNQNYELEDIYKFISKHDKEWLYELIVEQVNGIN